MTDVEKPDDRPDDDSYEVTDEETFEFGKIKLTYDIWFLGHHMRLLPQHDRQDTFIFTDTIRSNVDNHKQSPS